MAVPEQVGPVNDSVVMVAAAHMILELVKPVEMQSPGSLFAPAYEVPNNCVQLESVKAWAAAADEIVGAVVQMAF